MRDVFCPRFAAGQIVLSPGAKERLTDQEIKLALSRHRMGDWGDVDAQQHAANILALAEGHQLRSCFVEQRTGGRFFVVTEADRSQTTILLVEEY